jgi:hypothetical protein
MHKRLIKKLAALDIDRLHEVLDYDPETGVLSWRVMLSPRCKIGKPAGKTSLLGYRKISIDRVEYPAHHLAWFHFYEEPAEQELDFKNLDKTDLRIENLRLATRSQNACNKRMSPHNTTGLKGAYRFNSDRNLKKYRSSIRVDGKKVHLGQFATPEEAHEAYCKMAKELYGEFARFD